MQRRKFIKTAGLGLGAAALGTSTKVFAAPKKLRWRLALTIPKTLPIWGDGMERFAERVKELSGGDLRVKVYGAGELVPGLGVFESVSKGEIDMASSAAYYWVGKVPCSPFFANVPFGMDTGGNLSWIIDGEGQALWDEAMGAHNIKCLPCGATGPQMMGWFNRRIETPKDLSGLKIRIPGIAGRVYAKAGAKPILLPGGEIFTGLSTGVIDAAEWVGPYHDYLMGFQKAAKYYYGPSWHEPGAILELMINRNSWLALPKELQTVIESAAAETTVWMRAKWDSKNAEYLEKLRAEGKVEVLFLPQEVLNFLRDKNKEVLAEIASSDALSQKVLASYKKYKSRYESYQTLASNGESNW